MLNIFFDRFEHFEKGSHAGVICAMGAWEQLVGEYKRELNHGPKVSAYQYLSISVVCTRRLSILNILYSENLPITKENSWNFF